MSKDWSSLKQRSITAVVMLAVAAVLLWLGGWALTLALLLAALQMLREWLAMRPQGGWGWKLAGVAYCTLPCLALVMLRQQGLAITLLPLAMVAATDTGAYFSGKIIGGAKLAPRISPNKTWAGLIGGMIAASVVAFFCDSPIHWLLLGVSIAVLGQAGDLLESWLKRIHGVKDTGNLLPGHGGLMDRMDGYVFVLPFYLAVISL